MFGSHMQKRFAKLEKKSLQQLNTAVKGATKSRLSQAIDAGVAGAISLLLNGLKDELVSIVKSRGDLPDSDQRIAAAFDLARQAVSKLLLAGDIKGGKAGWLTYALKGIEEPEKDGASKVPAGWEGVLGGEAAKSSDDVTPIWLRERE